jgi:hypothetical protein
VTPWHAAAPAGARHAAAPAGARRTPLQRLAARKSRLLALNS